MSRINVEQRELGSVAAPIDNPQLRLPFSHQVSWLFRLRAVYIESATTQSDAEYTGDHVSPRR